MHARLYPRTSPDTHLLTTTPPEVVEPIANQLYAIIVVFGVVAFIATVLRLIARRQSKLKFGPDDWLVMVLGPLVLGNIVSNIFIVQYGAREEEGDFSLALLRATFQSIYASQLFYVLGVAFTKFAILSLYLRLFGINAAFRQAVHVFTALTLMWGIASLGGTVFECLPIAGFWDPTIDAHCIDQTKYLLGTNVVDVVLDVGILTLPIPMVWRLQKVPIAKKLGVMFIFFLGFLDCTMAVVRLVVLIGNGDGNHSIGFTTPVAWSSFEIDIGTICVCLPVILPMFLKAIGQRRGSQSVSPDYRMKDSPSRYGENETNV